MASSVTAEYKKIEYENRRYRDTRNSGTFAKLVFSQQHSKFTPLKPVRRFVYDHEQLMRVSISEKHSLQLSNMSDLGCKALKGLQLFDIVV